MNNRFEPVNLSGLSCSKWQGGVTYELAIGGEGASYSERNFLYRISSAIVELDSSVFTSLPDYDRVILPLDAPLEIRHNNSAPMLLKPFETHRFDGAWDTISLGRAQDFNLMLRKGACRGDVDVLSVSGDETAVFDALPDALCRLFFCAEGGVCLRIGEREFTLEKGDSLRTDGEAVEIHAVSTGAKLVIAWVSE